MNSKQILGVLLAITFFVAGCKPENFTGSAANGTPVPQQTLRLSEPVKVTLSDPAINLERLGNITLAGNTLVATTNISDTSRPVSIDLENGQVLGLQSSLRLTSTGTTITRYIPRWTSYTKDKRSFGALFVYDLQRGQEVQIANNLPAVTTMSNDVVAWQGSGEGGWNIYAYDISVNQMFTVTHGAGTRAYPHVTDGWVIYLDMGQDAILHAYNLSTQETLTLGAVPHPRGREGKYHLIGDGKIVWADAGTYDLHVLDLSTRATEVITDPVTTCEPLYTLRAIVKNTLLYFGCEGWMLYDIQHKLPLTIPVLPSEIRGVQAQNQNEDATYSVAWIVMSDTRLAWTVIDGLGHSWLYTSRVER
jgi:hypothetical protein